MTLAEVKKAGVPLLAYGSFLTVLLDFLILAFIMATAPRQSATNGLCRRSSPKVDIGP